MHTLNLLLNLVNGKKDCKNNAKTDFEKTIGNSKSGYLKIKKVSKNMGYLMTDEEFAGYAPIFGTGFSVYLINQYDYFHTSLVIEIDWENHILHTQNSEYSFEFREIKDLDKLIEEYKNENLRTK